MSKREEDGCPYLPNLTSDEVEGLVWLERTLNAIIDKGEGHRSYTKALACDHAITKIVAHVQRMHAHAHDADDAENVPMEIAALRMALQPMGDA